MNYRNLLARTTQLSTVIRYTLCTYIVTFGFVLPVLCRNWAHSPYFLGNRLWTKEELTKKALEVNEQRLNLAIEYVNKLSSKRKQEFYKDQTRKTDLVIGVVTVKRTGGEFEVGYLTQVLARLDAILNQHARNRSSYTAITRISLFICNVFAGPGTHFEAQSLQTYFTIFTRFPEESKSHAIMHPFAKEREDYAYCLQQALQFEANYVILLEDDALPQEDFLDVLDLVLQRIEKEWQGNPDSRFGLLKLFYPDKWQGYSNDLRTLMELVGVGCLCGPLYAGMLLYCGRRRRWTRFIISLVFTLGGLYSILVAVSIGRTYLLDFRKLSRHLYVVKPATGCCTPANLYTSEAATMLQERLSRKEGYPPLDVSIDLLLERHSFDKYLIEPNLVKHIGFISTLKGMSSCPEEFIF